MVFTDFFPPLSFFLFLTCLSYLSNLSNLYNLSNLFSAERDELNLRRKSYLMATKEEDPMEAESDIEEEDEDTIGESRR